jgi:aconitate hydratase
MRRLQQNDEGRKSVTNSFGARSALHVGDRDYEIFRLDRLERDFGVSRLPYSLKILLENLLRHEGSPLVDADDVAALAGWRGGAEREIAFRPARVLMQDFTGVPAVVDLAAMRDAMATLGRTRLDPLLPVDLVIDHSVTVDAFGTRQAFARNVEIEYARNEERYRLLRWAQRAFTNLRVVPPGTGICHQVNLEFLAQVVRADDEGRAYPDTLVGTDSHTPMINGLGVLGWGVGGIEAEAALLGQPVSLLTPKVIGIELSGELRPGTTATDLVLTVTELLRHRGVVGKFVEFYGPGVAEVSLENRATLGNMSPEYGSTVTIFPVDDETLRYLRFTGRPAELVDRVEAYAKEQGLWHEPGSAPTFSDTVHLDLSTVVPCIAGPARPQDRVPLEDGRSAFRAALPSSIPPAGAEARFDRLPLHIRPATPEAASAQSFPASDPPAAGAGASGVGEPDLTENHGWSDVTADRPRAAVTVERHGESFTLDHGHVVIAAITSCTNTSNPSVMLAAGLLARKAVDHGLTVKPWVKTSLAPGSQVVMDYYAAAGLVRPLERLGFNLVGFGCTTCIGNSGPLPPDVARAVADGGLAVASVLSGNRNFEGRINPDVRMNYLMSPPLVVAYALAGTVDIDLTAEPLGTSTTGTDVYLRDIWPSRDEIDATLAAAVGADMFTETYGAVFGGDQRWRALDTPIGERFEWEPESTYVRRPPFLAGITPEPPPAVASIAGARALAHLGDSVTTDHISPAGAIAPDSPAGQWLLQQGVARTEFNSYGARRGNHEVMIRGTFANGRIRNRLAGGAEGGVTVHLPEGSQMSIYDAAVRYAEEGTPLIVLAGKEYGSGSSRDWAAKGTALLGVQAVLAESFERIHRSNLIGMGVLPLQYVDGESAASLGLSGRERFDIDGTDISALPSRVTVRADGREFQADVRIDTAMELDYYHHGGILPYVLRALAPAR